jgi:hypothetical protein
VGSLRVFMSILDYTTKSRFSLYINLDAPILRLPFQKAECPGSCSQLLVDFGHFLFKVSGLLLQRYFEVTPSLFAVSLKERGEYLQVSLPVDKILARPQDIMKTNKGNVNFPPVNVLSTFRMEKDSTETTLRKLGEVFARVISIITNPYV